MMIMITMMITNIQGGVGRSEAKYESQMRRIAQIFRIMRILRSIEWICFNQTRLCIIEMGSIVPMWWNMMMILKRKDIQVGSPHHWSPDVGAHIALQVITIETIIIVNIIIIQHHHLQQHYQRHYRHHQYWLHDQRMIMTMSIIPKISFFPQLQRACATHACGDHGDAHIQVIVGDDHDYQS